MILGVPGSFHLWYFSPCFFNRYNILIMLLQNTLIWLKEKLFALFRTHSRLSIWAQVYKHGGLLKESPLNHFCLLIFNVIYQIYYIFFSFYRKDNQQLKRKRAAPSSQIKWQTRTKCKELTLLLWTDKVCR